ncbi:hypothetical protein Clacol_002848 [Clathrus columnatus]|uniref:Glutathione peroxidase n=1 Tax=Clathrus columnatus TaxID=1419009 RepID=A0AAV5A5X1_9AGAM|nr:hypothetical protein Clacol_002848 [Clathrus columnatus]
MQMPTATALQALYDKYKEKDFIIVGFPCNQFGGQEPGTDEEIAQFCTKNHGVTFPLMKKSEVNGDNTNEFLIDREGKVVNRYASTTSPESIDNDVATLL